MDWKNCIHCGQRVTVDFPSGIPVMCDACYRDPFPQCSFCGGTNQPIHINSQDQYGEPVCTVCFNRSYQPDEEQLANSPDDLYGDLYREP